MCALKLTLRTLCFFQGQWSRQPATILRWFAAVISFLDAATLQRFVVQMATPIFRISEDPNAQDPQMGKFFARPKSGTHFRLTEC